MLLSERTDHIQIAFDDHRLVANAGLILPVTLARHLGLGELADKHVDVGRAPGRANPGDKIMTLVASAPRFHGGRLCRATAPTSTLTKRSGAGPGRRRRETCAWEARQRCRIGSAPS